MSSARQRPIMLLLLATAVVLLIVGPQFSDAQEATPAAGSGEASDLVTRGEALFATTCIACHQAAGEGVTDVAIGGFPALAGNPFVTLEDPAPMVQTILNGRAGMPNFRSFSDEEIAAVASYVRQAWGNEAGPVDPALVAEIRAQFAVSPVPDATPIATELAGSLASPVSGGATPAVDGSPEAAGGAAPGGVTPIPTVGQ